MNSNPRFLFAGMILWLEEFQKNVGNALKISQSTDPKTIIAESQNSSKDIKCPGQKNDGAPKGSSTA